MGVKHGSIAKISRPVISGIAPRKRLFNLLDNSLKRPVVWVSTHAGSGKTTLVASYLDSRRLPCLWYQADEGDADISTFFYYMGIAAKKANPRKKKPLPLLTPEYFGGIPVFTRRYFEELYSSLTHHSSRLTHHGFIIVIDNYQEAPSDSQFHEMLANGLEVIPEDIKVIIISRTEPRPQFIKYRANNEK